VAISPQPQQLYSTEPAVLSRSKREYVSQDTDASNFGAFDTYGYGWEATPNKWRLAAAPTTEQPQPQPLTIWLWGELVICSNELFRYGDTLAMLYFILRQINVDEGGRGRVELQPHKATLTRFRGWQRLLQLLKSGDGVYWNYVPGKRGRSQPGPVVYPVNVARLAIRLQLDTPTKTAFYPANYDNICRKTDNGNTSPVATRSVVAVAVMAGILGNKKEAIVSQAGLGAKISRSRQTANKYLKSPAAATAFERRHNWAIVPCRNLDEAKAVARHMERNNKSNINLSRWFAGKIKQHAYAAYRRLPDTYTSQFQKSLKRVKPVYQHDNLFSWGHSPAGAKRILRLNEPKGSRHTIDKREYHTVQAEAEVSRFEGKKAHLLTDSYPTSNYWLDMNGAAWLDSQRATGAF